MPQYVRDPVTGKWVVSASESAQQPRPEPAKAPEAPPMAVSSPNTPKVALAQRSMKEDLKAELKAELTAEIKAELVDDFRKLRLRVEHLERELQSQSKDGARGRDKDKDKARDAPDEKAATQQPIAAPAGDKENDKDEGGAETQAQAQARARARVQESDQHPITERQAYEAIGGQAELAVHAERSRSLCASVTDTNLHAEIQRLLPRDYVNRTSFSTVLVNQPYVTSLEQLYERAALALPQFERTVEALARATGGLAVVAPLKGKERAKLKALFKYKDAGGGGVAGYRLTDIVRGTLVFDSVRGMYDGLEAVVQCADFEVKELNDRYQLPMASGYCDIQLVVQLAQHMCELQLTTEAMHRAKQTSGHRTFEVVRELRAAIPEGSLVRVAGAFKLGLDHLGSTKNGDSKAELRKLLRANEARTLIHDAARRGHADIVHVLLRHGADANGQDERGETPLHLAVFGGHERCVWALLDSGSCDLDIENNEEQTALVKAYLMLWRRPPEQQVRALSTLVQMAGAERIRAARAVVAEHVRKQLHPSRTLVDHAADGDVEKMREELRRYADPASKSETGRSALEAAAAEGQIEAVNMLLDFEARPGEEPGLMQVALESAVQDNTPRLLRLLHDKGACMDAGEGTPSLLQVAMRAGCSLVVLRTLMELQVPLETRNGAPPLLQLALDANRRDAFETLLRAGAPSDGLLAVASIIPCDVDGDCKWFGIAAVGKKLYCAPHTASSILVIDSEAKTVHTIPCGVDGKDKFTGIAAVGTKLYCCPHSASSVLVIDTVTEAVRSIPCGVAGEFKWNGIVAVDTKLFCAPCNAPCVLVIDTETDAVRTIACGVMGQQKWRGIAAVGTRLYCCPGTSPSVLVIDSDTEAVHYIACGVKGERKWQGIAAVGATLYCAPLDASSILVVDSEAESVRTIPCGEGGNDREKWSGITAVGTKLYCPPRRSSSVLVIDSETDSVDTIPCGVDGDHKYWGSAAVGNQIFCSPSSAPSVLALEDRLRSWDVAL